MTDDIDIKEPKLGLEIKNPKLMNDVPDVCNNKIIEDQPSKKTEIISSNDNGPNIIANQKSILKKDTHEVKVEKCEKEKIDINLSYINNIKGPKIQKLYDGPNINFDIKPLKRKILKGELMLEDIQNNLISVLELDKNNIIFLEEE